MNDKCSDILLTLQNVEALCGIYHNLHNSYAGAALIVAIMTEAHTLSLKLQQMNMRWQEHMPFKEACDVDFGEWHRRIQALGHQFKDDELPSTLAKKLQNGNKGSYLLDLYDLLPLGKDADDQLIYKEEPYFMADTESLYIERAEKMQSSLTDNYDECLRSVSRFVVKEGSVGGLGKDTPEVFWNMLDMYLTNQHCSQTLFRLADELEAIRVWIDMKHERADLEKLADRIFLAYGKSLKQQVQTDLTRWENTCPDEDLNTECQLQIDMGIEMLKNWEFGREFRRYVKPNVDLRLQKGMLGKFFFTFRSMLKPEHIENIIYSHYHIQFFMEYQENAARQKMSALEESGNSEGHDDSAIVLPVFFAQELRDDEKMARHFVSLLGTVEAKVNQSGSDVKWSHVFEALKRLEFIPLNTRNVDFSKFIHTFFSNRTVASVNRDLYRFDPATFEQIVGDVMKVFQTVKKGVFGEVNSEDSGS